MQEPKWRTYFFLWLSWNQEIEIVILLQVPFPTGKMILLRGKVAISYQSINVLIYYAPPL